MAKKSFVTSVQNVVQDQAGKIVHMAKAGYEGAKSLVGDAVTGTAKTAKTLIGKPKLKAASKKKAAALKRAVTKKSPKNAAKKSSTKAAKKKSTVKNSAKRRGPGKK
jgi:hypothetical protein